MPISDGLRTTRLLRPPSQRPPRDSGGIPRLPQKPQVDLVRPIGDGMRRELHTGRDMVPESEVIEHVSEIDACGMDLFSEANRLGHCDAIIREQSYE